MQNAPKPGERSPRPTLLLCMQEAACLDFFPPDLMHRLRSLPVDVEILPPQAAWHADADVFRRLKPAILLSGWGAPRLPASRDDLPGLEYVCYVAGSVRGLVPRSLLEQGLKVSNWGTAHAATVAECALMLVLACLRRVVASTLALHVERDWLWPDRCRPLSLYGRRVGLHGMGAVARALVPLLRPFGCELSAYSAGVPAEVFAAAGLRQAESLDDLFATSEVLVECEAASPQHLGTVREAHLRRLPADGVFVNVGRAAVVDEEGLVRVAREGRLQFGLDVHHHEPLPADHPLRGLRNVCLLGHQAGPTVDRRRDCGEIALANLQRYLVGEDPIPLITPEAYDRST